jgi:hypothetical protein
VALPPAVQKTVSLTLTGCHLKSGDGLRLLVSAQGQAAVEVPGSVAPSAKPQWDWLALSFGLAALAALVLVVLVGGTWSLGQAGHTLRTPLPGLTSDYDFSKSWASNATVISAAFAGVFGASDVLKAIVGDKDDAIQAVVLVAAAVATALVVSGTLVVLATRSGKTVTSGGLMGAALVTTAGTGGQLGVLLLVAEDIELGRFRWPALVLGTAGAVLLGTYVYRSLKESLTSGLVAPTPAPAAALPPREVFDKMAEEGTDLYDVYSGHLAGQTSPGDSPRSAIL